MQGCVRGRTRFAGLFELIQISEMHRRSVAITVNHKHRLGKIFILDGVLSDAVYRDLRGDEAIVEVLRWIESFFELVSLRGKVQHTVKESTVQLLISALKGMGHVELPKSRVADTIVGPLELLSAAELLHLFEMNHRNAFITLRNDGAVGTVHVRDGKAIHATLGQGLGDEALIDMLTWKKGYFRVKYADGYVLQTVKSPIRDIMMEATKRVDERTHETQLMQQPRPESPSSQSNGSQ